ncbi:MAG TPA: V-type ATP synthase subunit F [Candidatus Blautia intestinipullorum]|nr:V-type ATP synthase subunit F [Candidatus Blautia intestinipullorum]
MYKIAVMGDYDSIYGFAALGLSVFPAEDEESCRKTLNRLVQSGYGVIYITESKAALVEEEISRYREQRLPAIILIPGISGNTGAGIAQVKKSVEQAVGSDIIFTE